MRREEGSLGSDKSCQQLTKSLDTPENDAVYPIWLAQYASTLVTVTALAALAVSLVAKCSLSPTTPTSTKYSTATIGKLVKDRICSARNPMNESYCQSYSAPFHSRKGQ